MSIHCISCQTKIPTDRLELVENTSRCARCQETYELEHPESVARKATDFFLVSFRVKKYNTTADITPSKANGIRAAKVVFPKMNKEPAWR